MDTVQPVAGVPISQPVVAAGRPTRALPWLHLLNLSVYWLGINVIWSGLGTLILPRRLEDLLGLLDAPIGLAIATYVPVVLAIVVQPTVAAISDYTVTRWGRRKPYILIGTVLDIIFLVGLATSNTVVGVLAFLLLLQCSSNFAQGPFQGYVPDLVPARQVGIASGLMGVMIILGQMTGVVIAGIGLIMIGNGVPVNEAFLWPTIGLGVIELVTMVPLILFIDEGRAAPPRAGRSWLQIARSTWGTDILRERSYVWLLVSRLFFLAAPATLLGLGYFYVTRTLGFVQAPGQSFLDGAAGAFLIIAGVMGVTTGLATFPAARLSDRLGRKRIIYGAIALGAVGMLGVIAAPSFEWTVVALIPVGISAGSFLAVDWALMTDIIPKATSGRYMGISNVATAISSPLAIGVGGVVLYLVTLAGLPAPGAPAEESTLFNDAPRFAFAIVLVFFAISAWTLRHVDETRRED